MNECQSDKHLAVLHAGKRQSQRNPKIIAQTKTKVVARRTKRQQSVTTFVATKIVDDPVRKLYLASIYIKNNPENESELKLKLF